MMFRAEAIRATTLDMTDYNAQSVFTPRGDGLQLRVRADPASRTLFASVADLPEAAQARVGALVQRGAIDTSYIGGKEAVRLGVVPEIDELVLGKGGATRHPMPSAYKAVSELSVELGVETRPFAKQIARSGITTPIIDGFGRDLFLRSAVSDAALAVPRTALLPHQVWLLAGLGVTALGGAALVSAALHHDPQPASEARGAKRASRTDR